MAFITLQSDSSLSSESVHNLPGLVVHRSLKTTHSNVYGGSLAHCTVNKRQGRRISMECASDPPGTLGLLISGGCPGGAPYLISKHLVRISIFMKKSSHSPLFVLILHRFKRCGPILVYYLVAFGCSIVYYALNRSLLRYIIPIYEDMCCPQRAFMLNSITND